MSVTPPSPTPPSTLEAWTRGVSLLEGLSYVVLVGIAMPLKYGAGLPAAVRISGMAHGILFVALGLLVLALLGTQRWPWSLAARVMVIALVPFGALWLERRWRARGSLAAANEKA